MGMTVYRIQHKETKEGPYNGNLAYSKPYLIEMSDRHKASGDRHPHPRYDAPIGRGSNDEEFCGFNSMEQLQEWFTGDELSELSGLGFEVVCLEDVTVTAIGDKQILFTLEGTN